MDRDRGMQRVQQVTATAGFAYGLIGADMHVFGDGSPVYLLENWHAAPDVDAAWLRQMPSRMLNPRFAVVGFTGRQDELAQLHQWRRTGPRLAARWLHGPGGAGKTRLAAQFAAESAAAGWKAVTATHGSVGVLPSPSSQDMRIDQAAGLLLIVDYADRWPHTDFNWLAGNALFHQAGVPTRVLLIARTTGAWLSFQDSFKEHQAETSSQALGPVPDSDEHRLHMFTAARDAFARRYEIGYPAALDPPTRLDGREWGLLLALHMAALVAVDAYVNGRRPPADVAGLTIYLLDRENEHWNNLYSGSAQTAASLPLYQTPPHVMNQAVFTAALTGPVVASTGTAILARVRLPADPERVLADHATCYPPPVSTLATVLEPLYPDRLAEDFLALTLPGHPADYPAQTWASDVATSLLADVDEDSESSAANTRYVSRAVTFLAAAADRWPHVGDTLLYPLLRRRPGLAVMAGSPALSTLAATDRVDFAVLEGIEPLLPDRPLVDLDVGAADIVARLLPHRLAATTDLAEQARLQLDCASRLSNAGRWEEALATAKEAADKHRHLVQHDASYLPDLATSVRFIGTSLTRLGRREEALTAAREAVTICQRVVQMEPAELPDLVTSMNNLGACLLELERRQEALAAAEETVRLAAQLVEAQLKHLPQFADALTNLGSLQAAQGDYHSALATTEAAVQVHRKLAALEPAAYQPGLARSLNSVAMRLADVGRWVEALTPAEEAVRCWKRLVQANPNAHLHSLAISLNNLALRLSEVGRRKDALACAEEALDVYRKLARSAPAAHLGSVAGALSNLARRLSEVGEHHEALTAAEEAVSIYRRLARTDPDVYTPHLAGSLINLTSYLRRCSRVADAVAAAEEATGLWRLFVDTNPGAHMAHLAKALNNLGGRLAETGRHDRAIASLEEAIGIFRSLRQTNPGCLPDLATALSNLANHLMDAGQETAALAAAAEAADLYRDLARVNPTAFLPDLAHSLGVLAWMSARTGRDLPGGLASVRECIALFGSLTEQEPGRFGGKLRLAYETAADVLERMGEVDQATELRRSLKLSATRSEECVM